MGREASRGKQSGRTQEIQRLIGRSLRQAVNLKTLGEQTLKIDCDVIQADGGTRTASITGACVALFDALDTLPNSDTIERQWVAAVSVWDGCRPGGSETSITLKIPVPKRT